MENYEVSWSLTVDAQAEMEVDGVNFTDVIAVVHWRVTAIDEGSGKAEAIYGSVGLVPPSSPAAFVEIDELQSMPPDQRRDLVLGWIEMQDADFANGKETSVRNLLSQRLSEPQVSSISIV